MSKVSKVVPLKVAINWPWGSQKTDEKKASEPLGLATEIVKSAREAEIVSDFRPS